MAWGQGKGRKSPLVARILSYIIPGLGHCYSNDYLAGFIRFLIAVPLWIGLYYLLVKSKYMHDWHVEEYGRHHSSPSEDFIYGIILYVVCYLHFCANSAASSILDYNSRIQMNEMFEDEKLQKEKLLNDNHRS